MWKSKNAGVTLAFAAIIWVWAAQCKSIPEKLDLHCSDGFRSCQHRCEGMANMAGSGAIKAQHMRSHSCSTTCDENLQQCKNRQDSLLKGYNKNNSE